ncbi:MAG: hypothetical protein HQL89_16240 [Magnetococcales bacterium]|nr:hypothetical protein [Magnetococcales bacterium]
MRGLESESALLRMQSRTDRAVGFNVYLGYEPQWSHADQEHFKDLDPYPEAIQRVAPTRMVICEQYLPKNDLLKGEYYNDFLRPQGKFHCMGGHILKQPTHFIQLGFQRGPDARGYDEKDLRALHLLEPHLRRVLTQIQQLTELKKQARIHEQISDMMPQGIIVFDQHLKPVFINRAAETILAGDSGLKLTPQGIAAPIPAESKQLQTMLRQGLQLATGAGLLEKNSLQLTHALWDRPPLYAVVIPLRPDRQNTVYTTPIPSVLLFLSTLHQPTSSTSEMLLKNLFGLTTAEAHLAQTLTLGSDLEEIAHTKGCTLHTVRNQLKAVFAKTGTRRQAELVRLLLSLPSIP